MADAHPDGSAHGTGTRGISGAGEGALQPVVEHFQAKWKTWRPGKCDQKKLLE
jgi:hypothetical protein